MEWQRYIRRPTFGRGYSPAARPYYPPRPSPYPPRGPPRGVLPARGPPALPVRRNSPPPRTASSYTPPQNAAFISHSDEFFTFGQEEKRVTDVCHRYPRMHLSPDFSKVVEFWSKAQPKVPLDVAINFHTDPDFTLPVPAEEVGTEGKHIARVMLLSCVKGDEGDDKKKVPKPHVSKQIKFLVAKRANGGLMSIGGPWSEAKDGANPSNDATLIKTAIRHCKEICGIDLSSCKNWIKFLEVHYQRPSGEHDRTVIFLPDIWNAFQGKEVNVYKQVQRQEVDVEEEVEVDVEQTEETADGTTTTTTKKIKKKVTTKKPVDNVVIRSMDLSLNGILEYDLQDKHEETTELSLFAEAFQEMISQNYGMKVLEILKVKKAESDRQATETKRKRDEEATEKAAKLAAEREERDAKRRKLDEEKKAELERRKKQEEEEKYMTDEQIKERRAKEAEERKKKEEQEKAKQQEEAEKRKQEEEARRKEREDERKKKEEEEKNKKTRTITSTTSTVDPEILEPFSFFDKPSSSGHQSGQLHRDRLAGVLNSLGVLCYREVEGLLGGVGLSRDKAAHPLFYKTLATTVTTITTEVPIEEPPPVTPAEAKPETEEKKAE